MKKSFKVLLLAVMALCLAASASFAVTKGYDAITSAAKTAAASIEKSSSTASTDVAIVSLIHTLAAASTNKFNVASKDAGATENDLTVLHKAAVTLATALSKDLAAKYVDPISKDAGENLVGAFVTATVETLNKADSTTLREVSKDSVSDAGKDLLVKAAAAFKDVDFGTAKSTAKGETNANAALYVYSQFFTDGESAKDAASEDISKFYKAAAENSDAFKDMLPKISAFLASKPTATPLDMLKEVAAFSNPFVSADVKVYANGTLSKTIPVSSDVSADTVYVDLGSKVSLDIALSTDVLGVSEDSTALTLSGDCYTLSNDFATSGDKAVVTITFASGDTASYVFKLTVIASGDSGGSGGDDGTGEVTVDSKAEEALENLGNITAANITSEDIIAAFEELGIDGELTIDTSTSFTLFNLVSNDKIAAIAIPALNADIALLTSGNAGSETIDATTALNTVSASELLKAITAFCANGWNTFVTTVFNTSDMTEDNAKGIDESAASETGEDGAYKSFGVALDKALPTGTILLFTLIDTDTDAQTYYAMVLPGDVNTEVSVIPFNVANLRAFDGSSTLGTSAPTIATSTYKIAYSTLDGGGADFSSASVLAAIKAAADEVETGEAAYVGEYALTSTSDSSSGEEPTDQVSSHGSSSGCDAGFGALALLAVAGALAARKVRK